VSRPTLAQFRVPALGVKNDCMLCMMQLWDLAKGECETTLSYHTDKVQSLAWNPQEAPVLLSGAFGGAVCLCDTRGGESAVATWSASTDIEAVAWGHSDTPTKFAVRSSPCITNAYIHACMKL
jgi:periodic tryptophan protein 1